MLRDNLEQVESRILEACRRAGRRREDITLVAVTKTFPAEVIQEAYSLGLRHFGENYVQEFEKKRVLLDGLDGACYHLIGHLQSNKSRRASELFHVVQTVDTVKLARRLNEAGRRLDVMIEVKLSEEPTKSGADPGAVGELAAAIREMPNLKLLGLMTMPPWSEDPESSRPYFRRLRSLAESHELKCLSMGMSHDLETAIEEGATHIRVGTAIFGRRSR